MQKPARPPFATPAAPAVGGGRGGPPCSGRAAHAGAAPNHRVPFSAFCFVRRYDLSKQGLTPQQCREALTAIGLEEIEVPSYTHAFDLAAFKALIPGTSGYASQGV